MKYLILPGGKNVYGFCIRVGGDVCGQKCGNYGNSCNHCNHTSGGSGGSGGNRGGTINPIYGYNSGRGGGTYSF